MVLEQLLDDRHPYASFHDASIERVAIDYVAQEAVLDLHLCIGSPDAPRGELREARAAGRLTLQGLLYFVVEPPDPRYPFGRDKGLWLTADGPLDELQDRTTKLPTELPEGVSLHYFYIIDWNAFIYAAFHDAKFGWVDEESRA